MTRPASSALVALFAVIIALLTMSGCVQSVAGGKADNNHRDPDMLIFAAMPTFRFAIDQQTHEAIIDMLEKETGKKILFQTGSDYAAIIKGLRDEKIDIAALSLTDTPVVYKLHAALRTHHFAHYRYPSPCMTLFMRSIRGDASRGPSGGGPR